MVRSRLLLTGLGLLLVMASEVWIGPAVDAQPAPQVYAYPVLYRLDHGRWQRSLIFTPGDRVRLVMPFLTIQPGWSFPGGTFKVQRERVPFYAQPVIFQHRMVGRAGFHGYTIFSVEFQMTGRRWLGHWIGQAIVTNGQGTIAPNFYFTVLPRLPRLFGVADAIALCRAHPALRRTILIGGVWGEAVTQFGQDGIARGWLGERWEGRGAIPHWWEHGALWMIFPRGTNAGYPPSPGFLQVRSRLDCHSHTLTALARPIIG